MNKKEVKHKIPDIIRVLEKWRENISGHRTDISPEEREKQKDGYYNLYKAMKDVKEEDELNNKK